MQIGELAQKADVNVQTIRFYERRRLLPDPPRKESGYRIYGSEDLHRLLFIRQAKALGFSLQEITTILQMRQGGQCPCGEVTKIAERRLREAGEQMERLRQFHLELSSALKRWKRSGTRNVSGDAICVLIERTMGGARKAKRRRQQLKTA